MNKGKNGFTLIELLVVIAIIGLLASIVIVNVNDAREKAKISKTRSQVNDLRTAAEILISDTGKWPFGCKLGNADNLESMLRCRQSGLSADPPIAGGPGAYPCPLIPPSNPDNPPGCCNWTEGTNCAWGNEVNNWKGPYLTSLLREPFILRGPRDPWGGNYIFDADLDLDNYCDNVSDCTDEEIFCKDCVAICSVPHQRYVVGIYAEGKDGNWQTCDDIMIILDYNPE